MPSWGKLSWPELQVRLEYHMHIWFSERGIPEWWTREPDKDKDVERALYFKFNHRTPWSTERMSRSSQAFAGTFLHSVWSVSDMQGELMISSNKSGHGGENHADGFYCSPRFDCAKFYAWSTNLFNDGLFHGAMYDVAVDAVLTKANQNNIGRDLHEMWLKKEQVQLRGMWILVDQPVAKGDSRFFQWERNHEILPPGRLRPAQPVYPALREFPDMYPWGWTKTDTD